MIITDGVKKINDETRPSENEFGKIILGLDTQYWYSELFVDQNGNIVKRFPKAGDVIEIFNNMNQKSDKVILLKPDDYNEFRKLYNNMQQPNPYRKKTLILSVANLFAYKCYQTYFLERLMYEDCNILFSDLVSCIMDYQECEEYREEIYERTRQILKNIYKIDLDKKIKGE